MDINEMLERYKVQLTHRIGDYEQINEFPTDFAIIEANKSGKRAVYFVYAYDEDTLSVMELKKTCIVREATIDEQEEDISFKL